MQGWIIDAFGGSTREEERTQPPLFFLDGGVPVFEVWFWHTAQLRWYVLTCAPNPVLAAQGVSFFSLGEVPEALRLRVHAADLANLSMQGQSAS
jgi:hypothetical protein